MDIFSGLALIQILKRKWFNSGVSAISFNMIINIIKIRKHHNL